MNTTHFPTLALAALSLALTACNHETSVHAPDESGDPDAGRYHENSFSWTDPTGPLAKPAAVAELAAKTTDFADGDAFVAAMLELENRLEDPEFSGSLWKPLDHACDELDLALWNTHGTVRVADSTVFDESILRSRCTYVGDDGEVLLKRTNDSNDNPPSTVTDRRYPYKMIGTSWSNFNVGVYKSTGGETIFQKKRKIWGLTRWYELDASRIGIRIYLFDCGNNDSRQRICWQRESKSAAAQNSGSISKRENAYGIHTKGSLAGFVPHANWIPVWTPDEFRHKLAQLDNLFKEWGLPNMDLAQWLGNFYEVTRAWTIPIPDLGLMTLRVADGVLSLHSVNHGGVQYRAMSSHGLGVINAAENVLSFDFVTW